MKKVLINKRLSSWDLVSIFTFLQYDYRLKLGVPKQNKLLLWPSVCVFLSCQPACHASITPKLTSEIIDTGSTRLLSLCYTPSLRQWVVLFPLYQPKSPNRYPPLGQFRWLQKHLLSWLHRFWHPGKSQRMFKKSKNQMLLFTRWLSSYLGMFFRNSPALRNHQPPSFYKTRQPQRTLRGCDDFASILAQFEDAEIKHVRTSKCWRISWISGYHQLEGVLSVK